MRKLIVTCDCGQRLQVPYSALGRMGMCSTCGRKMKITPDIARRDTSGGGAATGGTAYTTGRRGPSEEAKRKFGKAVDLFALGQHREALAIFDELALEFPGNPEIDRGRRECHRALRGGNLLSHDSGGATSTSERLKEGDTLDWETIERVVLEKLLYGASDSVQLEAARIACEYLEKNLEALAETNDAGDGASSSSETNGRHATRIHETEVERNKSSTPRDPAD